MKLYFQNAESLLEAIGMVEEDLSLTVTDQINADVIVTVSELDERRVSITLDGNKATIAYGDGKARFLRGLATLVDWIRSGVTKKESTEMPLFKTNGAMVDMSRNAVMNVKTVKTMLRKMALMGLNTFMLYTEDTYEIDGYPYFGYMRGRYTKAELKELDAYALSLGIEMIPCVQMLGHLATHLHWSASGAYRDTVNALLVGSEATEKLLRAMLESISECFTTRRIHVGMDETHDLGTGAYLDQYGYKDRQDIYFEHLNKVIALCREYGFAPMMWSDMFFRLDGRNIKEYSPEEYYDMFGIIFQDFGKYAETVSENIQFGDVRREHNPEDVRAAVDRVFDQCSGYENFMISSGCDIPADSKWENLDAYFARLGELYV